MQVLCYWPQGGESECSASSKSILAETRFIKPKINRDLLGTEKLAHVGQPLRLSVEIAAAPKPEVTFILPNGKSASADARFPVQICFNVAPSDVIKLQESYIYPGWKMACIAHEINFLVSAIRNRLSSWTSSAT